MADNAPVSDFSVEANRKIYQDLKDQLEKEKTHVAALEAVLTKHGIPLPDEIVAARAGFAAREAAVSVLMNDGTYESLQKSLTEVQDFVDRSKITIHFNDLTFWSMASHVRIPTVGSAFKDAVFPGEKHRVDVFKNLTGRIAADKMTLLLGPPGSGKSTFLKAMCGQLNLGKSTLDGTIKYNGQTPDSGKYLVGKLADYVDEKDQHAATLTVRETLEFAWLMTTGGHHSYGAHLSEDKKEAVDVHDKDLMKVVNVLRVLGLYDVQNTIVGDGALRGVSGGQKRRVTLGEMIMPNRRVKYMDAISNGLDSQTTFDIILATKLVSELLKTTFVISLLQPAPEVFNLFDEVIMLNEGQIIYHGPRNKVLEYFEGLGYQCPVNMDVADWLQELPTPEGRRFIADQSSAGKGSLRVPRGTTALVEAWKSSSQFQAMLQEMQQDEEDSKTVEWPADLMDPYPSTFWFSLKHCLDRQIKLTVRDTAFLTGRIAQSVLIGAIAGSLFSDLEVEDTSTMASILFFSALFNALSSFALLPVVFAQREVFYKHSRALFYHTPAFVISQTLVLYPLQVIETFIFSIIVYWSVGLTDDDGGARYFIFYLILFVFGLTVGQLFRFIGSFMDSDINAQPVGGVFVILMVLFSGYIISKDSIPPGWEWFYWINPLAYALQGLMINEFTASDYDFPACSNAPACTQTKKFGIRYLDNQGLPTDEIWIWYGLLILLLEYGVLIILSALALTYLRVEATPPAPVFVDEKAMIAADAAANESPSFKDGSGSVEIPFEPVSFAFKNIVYTVTLPSGEELDLLKGVSGFFEPGTVTALMGSSGAGKTTLLDVLSGRKNTGVIKGLMTVNGKEKDEHSFRRIMGYVEQFDTLAPHDTAREAIEFSAALRLPRTTSKDARRMWVDSVLSMLELGPIEHTMVGSAASGGMSFEQKKRVSIGVELAANPAILFLDEPTSGLDSRSAQVVVRCIRRVASSGRSIVCTIHQPSSVIFDAFDSLLLLRRGGQTVFFGDLGEHSAELVRYFEAAPGVAPMAPRQNPASWMLEVIGAGSSVSAVDFHEYYKQSTLCEINEVRANILASADLEIGASFASEGSGGARRLTPTEKATIKQQHEDAVKYKFNAPYTTQFKFLMRRFMLAFWRSPSYNFGRMVVSLLISLIFASTYANQTYNQAGDVVSRCAVLYITCLFCGVVAMTTVQSVMFGERPAFYREKFSEIYDTKLYTLAATLVELPYLVVSTTLFVLPFFYIVGFDTNDAAAKFGWYWLFQTLYVSAGVFIGHILAAGTPDAASAAVVGGMISTVLALFSGFMIAEEDIPAFWTFVYWLCPAHYANEGLIMTQFYQDDTTVTTLDGAVTTAEAYVGEIFSTWKYSQRHLDYFALLLMILALRVGTYFFLEYVRHDKR